MSGSVETRIRSVRQRAGRFQVHDLVTDLAVKGNGFFVVSNSNGQTYLTRAGSFVKDGDGDLVNAAGFKLMGYNLANGAPNIVTNGTAGLAASSISDGWRCRRAAPPRGNFSSTSPPDAAQVAACESPVRQRCDCRPTRARRRSSAYDNLGSEVTLDVYSAKTGTGTWEVTRLQSCRSLRPRAAFPMPPARSRLRR